jgi:hypothetical protein
VLRSNTYLPTPGGPDNSAALKKAPVSSLAQGPVKRRKFLQAQITTDKIWGKDMPHGPRIRKRARDFNDNQFLI